MSKEHNIEDKDKALHIADVSGSYSLMKLKWNKKLDKVFGEIYESETPLPSNFNSSRYEITKEFYDNYPIGYNIVLYCGNQGHPVKTKYCITKLDTAKEHAQTHFNNLILSCLTKIKNI